MCDSNTGLPQRVSIHITNKQEFLKNCKTILQNFEIRLQQELQSKREIITFLIQCRILKQTMGRLGNIGLLVNIS